MEQEKIIDKTTSYSINVAGGEVESLRVTEELTTVIRVYDKGCIGVAGAIGEGDEKELAEKAKGLLNQKIAYPCNLDENKQRTENTVKDIVNPGDYVKTAKKLLKRLNKTYPDFIFSNKINMTESEVDYSNSKNTHYNHKSNLIVPVLVIKAKSSANIMDLSYAAVQNYYDEDKIVEDIGKLLNVYNTPAEMPAEEVPVIIGTEILQYAMSEIVAEKYASGSSLFNGKLGQKIFDDKINLYTDRSPENKQCIPFFDAEGTTSEGDKFYFIKEGVLCGLATYKRSAANLNLPLSGGAYADFDAVPSASFRGLELGVTGKLKEIVKGKAIYVSVTSGGDMTPDGTLGLPVMLAYLYEDGKLLGKLPAFSLSANLFDLLGKDFCGIAVNDVFSYNEERVLVGKFKINKAN